MDDAGYFLYKLEILIHTNFKNGGFIMDGMDQGMGFGIVSEGLEVGIQNAISERTDEEMRMKDLSAKLIREGRQDDVQRAVSNEDYRQALYDEFEL